MIQHREIEFKYSARSISLDTFHTFCMNMKKHETYRANLGVDEFYANIDRPGTFFRLREDEGKYQLTYKRKLHLDNSIRVEYNLDLSNDKASAKALIQEMGYKYDTSINKVNHVHIFPWYVLSYYICYDMNMTELDRFIEIEMREDYTWSTEHEAFNELILVEKLMRPLGINKEGRMTQSLYEIFGSKK